MARCLIIAGGRRGVALARELRACGHSVRASTPEAARVAELEALGIEAALGDPDRVATLAAALEHISVAYILLGSATGPPERVSALHTTRLDMLLSRMLDSTVRGVAYEAAGTVAPGLLAAGAARVRAFCADARLRFALLETPPEEHERWLSDAAAAAERLLIARSP